MQTRHPAGCSCGSPECPEWQAAQSMSRQTIRTIVVSLTERQRIKLYPEGGMEVENLIAFADGRNEWCIANSDEWPDDTEIVRLIEDAEAILAHAAINARVISTDTATEF